MALKEEQGLGNWEIATAKKLVSEYRRRHRILQREEFDDLMQECLAHWIVVRRRIPPEPDPRPPVAYMAQVLRNKLTDLVREMTADKRAGDPGAFSLEAPIDGTDDGLTLGEVLADEQAAPDSGGIDSRHARIDLIRVSALLTPAQQRLCLLLAEEGLSIKEAAERLRIPRGTLYEEIKRIRRIFEQQGLGNYLKD
ncbi:MAG: sigma-70 family RNA polymerase sigma factor [Novosphingobium sp.]|nr:sigma-70 family RNA polymerase sigma factor [Novosphingobium sp.]